MRESNLFMVVDSCGLDRPPDTPPSTSKEMFDKEYMLAFVHQVFAGEEIEVEGCAVLEMKTHQSSATGQKEPLLPFKERGQDLLLKTIEPSQP